MLYKTNIEGFEEIDCNMVDPLQEGQEIMLYKRDIPDAPSYSYPVFFKITKVDGNYLELEPLILIPCRKHINYDTIV